MRRIREKEEKDNTKEGGDGGWEVEGDEEEE